MKLIYFKYESQRFSKDGEEITEQYAKKYLNLWQYEKLMNTGLCRVKNRNKIIVEEKIIEEKPIDVKNDVSEYIFSSKEEKLINKVKKNYKIDTDTYYNSGIKHTLWRLNSKHGYYNFASYLDNTNEDTFKKAILQDVDQLAIQAKAKKTTTELSEEE